MNIYDLTDGMSFKILKVKLNGEIGKRLSDMGFIKNAVGHIVRSALFGDPIEINLNGCNLSLRKLEAEGVDVEIVQKETDSLK
ncbi:MAG TPA: FeoA domain-containing protein [bacterium]|nr:FeoA domain-containing protein [bacterium]HPN31774.1 FeoA domain-containing protein [bacterium]